jgi:hypothetical protein
MPSKDRAFGAGRDRDEIQEILEGKDNRWATSWRQRREEKLVWLDKFLEQINLDEIRKAHSDAMFAIHKPTSPKELREALELTTAGLIAIDRLYADPKKVKVVAPLARNKLLEGFAILVDLGFATRQNTIEP